ncbi:hypothetical protein [Acidisphaera sp. L21]|uniref:hypothetical protein n=1 Tax=Acidisphaera sp. L21 TaxID=1641851 RepID=UPI00131DD414|nr:hypothetical protein [Acidisphaera sp. L21]
MNTKKFLTSWQVFAAACLAATVLIMPVAAQTALKRGTNSSSPFGSSTPVADLPTYQSSLQVALGDLRDAAGRPEMVNASKGANDEELAHATVVRALQQALGIVRSAPRSFRDEQVYKDAEKAVQYDTQEVEGQHEPTSMTKQLQDAITAIETLSTKMASATPNTKSPAKG